MRMSPNVNFDGRYIFYYDETNNPRKLYVKETEFNSPYRSNFVLGGLVFENQEINLDSLFSGLKLQSNVFDVKLRHLASGDFSECIKSNKLNYFLEYLYDNKILVHTRWVNFLYWSTVDIVDSFIANSEVAMKVAGATHAMIKDALYQLAKEEIDSFIDLFYRYQYPNIKKENVVGFLEELESLFYPYIDDDEFHFGLEYLRQILHESKRKQELPFINNEEDHVLLKEFQHFYITPVGLFKNSQHIFDNEAAVRDKMNKLKIIDGEEEIRNYSFVDSAQHRPIQASDIYVGIMGKFTGFINSNSPEQIMSEMNSWSEMQLRNTQLLMRLMNSSADVNPGFLHTLDSQWERRKVVMVCKSLDAL